MEEEVGERERERFTDEFYLHHLRSRVVTKKAGGWVGGWPTD